jgi:hypothetical protein
LVQAHPEARNGGEVIRRHFYVFSLKLKPVTKQTPERKK